MIRFLHLGHGMENYEELINLDQIDFVRVSWVLLNGAEGDWTGSARIVFRSGAEQTVSLTEKGFEKLCKLLVKKRV